MPAQPYVCEVVSKHAIEPCVELKSPDGQNFHVKCTVEFARELLEGDHVALPGSFEMAKAMKGHCFTVVARLVDVPAVKEPEKAPDPPKSAKK